MQHSLFLFLLLFSTSCFSQKTNHHLNATKQGYEKSITLSGFSSSDTTSITFLNKEDTWFILVNRQNPLAETQTQVCRSCEEVFTDAFLDKLFALKTEKVPPNGCRIVHDTIIDGKKIGSFEDFYLISDLEKQTITVTKGGKTSFISYIEPRYALKYCKDNTNRLAFIKASDRLLKIK